tara:strand:+ start:3721 stop:4092 length:372 start_codon:yes stop_codon:yes gene_type:complete
MAFSPDTGVRDWSCSKCKGDEYAEGDKYRKIRNCDSEKNLNIAWDWMPSLRRCPWSQIDEEALMMVGWWSEYTEFGVLPWGGKDLMKQPAIVLDVFVLCTGLKNEIELKRAREGQKKWQQTAK